MVGSVEVRRFWATDLSQKTSVEVPMTARVGEAIEKSAAALGSEITDPEGNRLVYSLKLADAETLLDESDLVGESIEEGKLVHLLHEAEAGA